MLSDMPDTRATILLVKALLAQKRESRGNFAKPMHSCHVIPKQGEGEGNCLQFANGKKSFLLGFMTLPLLSNP